MPPALLDTDILSELIKLRNTNVPQMARFATFCQHAIVLSVTETIFDRAADLWVLARQGGHPRNDADLIIAATALENGRVLVTGNTAHFSWIPGLTIEDWRQP